MQEDLRSDEDNKSNEGSNSFEENKENEELRQETVKCDDSSLTRKASLSPRESNLEVNTFI